VLVDLAVQHFSRNKKSYDENGSWARRGITSEKFLKQLLRHSYFKKSPPKSTGRELFSSDFFDQILKDSLRVKTPLGTRLSSYDLVSTLTDFTAQSIALNYRSHLSSKPDIVVLSGGGAQNPELVKRIKLAMHKWDGHIKVTTSEALKWNSQWIEAAAFALLAYRRWNNLPGNLPETTGATRAAVLGQLAIP
jgi:anhydro-N-acetylmuramic acid kinase